MILVLVGLLFRFGANVVCFFHEMERNALPMSDSHLSLRAVSPLAFRQGERRPSTEQ